MPQMPHPYNLTYFSVCLYKLQVAAAPQSVTTNANCLLMSLPKESQSGHYTELQRYRGVMKEMCRAWQCRYLELFWDENAHMCVYLVRMSAPLSRRVQVA